MEKLPGSNHDQNKQETTLPKIQEYIDRVKQKGETLESFGEIPESWKKIIRENTEEKTKERDEKTTNKEMSTADQIANTFNQIAMAAKEGLGNNFEVKINQYVDRIKNGEPKEKVLEGLPNSFTSAVEASLIKKDLLDLYSSEKKENGLDNLPNMTQLEFAKWLQENKSQLEQITRQTKSLSGKEITINPFGSSLSYYELLTLRPEYRAQAVTSVTNRVIEPSFDDERDYFKKTRLEEEKYKNSDSNPAWLGLNFGNTENKEKDGMRRKGYITIEKDSIEAFKENIPEILREINNSLDGKYNGAFKMNQSLSSLLNQFDNIVLHGADESEVEIAMKIVTEVLKRNNIENKISQRGKDGFNKKGEKTSHTKLLEEKVLDGVL